MAFESFRTRDERGTRRRRHGAFALVTVFHSGLIAAGVAYSYWHVEELTPPRLRVTFMSMAPLPPPSPRPAGGREDAKKLAAPPPPPPVGGHAGSKKVAIVTKVYEPPENPTPATKELRQPETEYDEEDNAKPSASAAVHKDSIDDADLGGDHGVKGGVKAGTIGGRIGGAIGGTIGGVAAAPGPRWVSPQVGALLKESGNMPPFSTSLMHDKVVYVVDTKICVSTTGAVYRLTIKKRSGTVLDASVVDTVKTWRYRPMTVNNTPVSFCYPVRFEFRSES